MDQLAPPSTLYSHVAPLAIPLACTRPRLVIPSPARPVSATSASAGAAGAVRSIVTVVAPDIGLVLPASSVAIAATLSGPSAVLPTAIDQAPPDATAVPSTAPVAASTSATVTPSSALPSKLRLDALVRPSLSDTPLSLPAASSGADGASGARLSNDTETLPPAPALPAASA
jgi:hypothetical protein